jgi:hypothetical protein
VSARPGGTISHRRPGRDGPRIVAPRRVRAGHPVGLGVTPHSFRRTVATVIDRAGGADLAVEMLGHSSSEIAKKHYIEPDQKLGLIRILEAKGIENTGARGIWPPPSLGRQRRPWSRRPAVAASRYRGRPHLRPEQVSTSTATAKTVIARRHRNRLRLSRKCGVRILVRRGGRCVRPVGWREIGRERSHPRGNDGVVESAEDDLSGIGHVASSGCTR